MQSMKKRMKKKRGKQEEKEKWEAVRVGRGMIHSQKSYVVALVVEREVEVMGKGK